MGNKDKFTGLFPSSYYSIGVVALEAPSTGRTGFNLRCGMTLHFVEKFGLKEFVIWSYRKPRVDCRVRKTVELWEEVLGSSSCEPDETMLSSVALQMISSLVCAMCSANSDLSVSIFLQSF
ncbi:unnamed protein product [Protopolystoma xenopodis]|uniref:Uncharacterized protein n=1 Tax=Protopolystoma xenopodis TaxID=117903 RepID=A0A3S5FEI7_9PLAT|nr:unnamed protein product [Protopolystoma xenopodis]